MKQNVYVSDLSRKTITGPRATMEIRFINEDGTTRREMAVLDLTEDEGKDFFVLGRKLSVRGRRKRQPGKI